MVKVFTIYFSVQKTLIAVIDFVLGMPDTVEYELARETYAKHMIHVQIKSHTTYEPF